MSNLSILIKTNIINEFKLNALKKLIVEKNKNNGDDTFSCYYNRVIDFLCN